MGRPNFTSVLALVLTATIAPLTGLSQDRSHSLPKGVSFHSGSAINGVTVSSGTSNQALHFYRPASPDSETVSALCLTHLRRDLVEAARPHVDDDTRVLAPGTVESSKALLTDPQSHWEAWWNDRFDYYGQQVTRLPTQPLPPTDWVVDDQTLEVNGISITVLATPGVTREGVTYLFEVEGRRIACSGNLILEGGRVPDLYSFQEAIPDAKVGAYHGYGGRLGTWIQSLETLAATKPDFLLPSQGPPIENPSEAIGIAIRKSREIYSNYLSTNALHWYFGEERMRSCADKVLGPEAPMESMPLAQHVDLPGWVQHIGTTKLLISESKAGFALDVGSPKALETLQQAVKDGLVTGIEGIWVTHRHNDHTRSVREAQEAFGCPVYAIEAVASALTDPGTHFSPGLSPHAVREVTIMEDGEAMTWHEFSFTARFFPGQMLDHGGLLVRPPAEKGSPVFFIGDSFSPSGIDDYCLMNRNLMREDTGFLRCFEIVREELPDSTWLVNQHIPHLFRFTSDELDYLEGRYRYRMGMISDFTPWDDPNFAIDEQWAWLFPYGQEKPAGAEFEVQLHLNNHSTKKRVFTLTPHAPPGVKLAGAASQSIEIDAREVGTLTWKGRLAEDAPPGVRVLTVSLESEGLDLPHWAEALIRVKAP